MNHLEDPGFKEAVRRCMEFSFEVVPCGVDKNIERWRVANVQPQNKKFFKPGDFIVVHPLTLGRARISISAGSMPVYTEFW